METLKVTDARRLGEQKKINDTGNNQGASCL